MKTYKLKFTDKQLKGFLKHYNQSIEGLPVILKQYYNIYNYYIEEDTLTINYKPIENPLLDILEDDMKNFEKDYPYINESVKKKNPLVKKLTSIVPDGSELINKDMQGNDVDFEKEGDECMNLTEAIKKYSDYNNIHIIGEEKEDIQKSQTPVEKAQEVNDIIKAYENLLNDMYDKLADLQNNELQPRIEMSINILKDEVDNYSEYRDSIDGVDFNENDNKESEV